MERAMQFGKLSLKQCRYGWMLYNNSPYIGKCFDLYGQYSESEVALLRNFLREGSVAIDVGANIGDLTLPMARMAGVSGRVIAIESHPVNFNILCANLALNNIRNVRPINAFVSDAEIPEESRRFVGNDAAAGTLSLDTLDLESCALVKIDVDGGELEVLRSGAMHIERFRPILYFENDIREKSADLLGYAKNVLGYELYFHPAPIFDADNFFGNPVYYFGTEVSSLMILGVPPEWKMKLPFRPVTSANEWWDDVR
jgi:FkbM family methyltransferase